MNMVPMYCPETSVTDCQATPSNISEQRRPHLNRCGILKSGVTNAILQECICRSCGLRSSDVAKGHGYLWYHQILSALARVCP